MSQTALYPAAFTRKAAECSAASSEISISNFAFKEAASKNTQSHRPHFPRMRSLYLLGDNALCICLAITPFVRYRYFELTGSMSEDYILKVTCAAVYWLLLFAGIGVLFPTVCCIIIIIGCYCLLRRSVLVDDAALVELRCATRDSPP
jgi:hypothetical protein